MKRRAVDNGEEDDDSDSCILTKSLLANPKVVSLHTCIKVDVQFIFANVVLTAAQAAYSSVICKRNDPTCIVLCPTNPPEFRYEPLAMPPEMAKTLTFSEQSGIWACHEKRKGKGRISLPIFFGDNLPAIYEVKMSSIVRVVKDIMSFSECPASSILVSISYNMVEFLLNTQ